jgi:hypothetical protein
MEGVENGTTRLKAVLMNKVIPATNSLAEATAVVSAYESSLTFLAVAPGGLSFTGGRLGAGGTEYTADLKGLCDGLGIPSGYVPELPEELRDRVLNFELARVGATRPTALVAQNGRFLRFDRGDLAHLSGVEVLETLADTVGGGAVVHALEVEGETLRVEVVTRQTERAVRAGDVVRGGIQLMHSLSAAHPTTILTFLVRLICRNGWTARSCAGTRQVPRVRRLPLERSDARERMVAQVRRVARESLNLVEEKITALGELANQPLRNQSDVERVWTRYLGRVRLDTAEIFDELRTAWHQERELTVYGALNAMTQVASHRASLDRWKRDRLAALAGVLTSAHTHLCPRCYSVLLR